MGNEDQSEDQRDGAGRKAPLTGRREAALRKGRWRGKGGEFFITSCTRDRTLGLAATEVRTAVMAEARRLEAEGVWRLRCMVVMPDHWHGVVVVAGDVVLGDAMRLFKGRTAVALRGVGLAWQPAYFDHRLRADEDREAVFRYVFMNPYRKRLCAVGESWPGYWCRPTDWLWFEALTADGGALPDWLE